MEAEHATIDPALAASTEAFAAMVEHPCEDHRHALEIRLAAAHEGLLEHLAHEEGQALPMLQRTLSEQENAAFERAVERAYPLRIVPFGLPWAMDGLPAEARERMLASTPPGYGLVLRLLEGGYRAPGTSGVPLRLIRWALSLPLRSPPDAADPGPPAGGRPGSPLPRHRPDPGTARWRTRLVQGAEVWVKDEGRFGDGAWGGNKVRKLEWIMGEARRRGTRTLFTVGGIGTHWGLAAALYGREHGLRTMLGLVDQPVDDHVREQLARLEASVRTCTAIATPVGSAGCPGLIASAALRDRKLPWYLPAGGSNEFGALAYVDTALEIAAQVHAGELPEPATVVTAVGSGGTAAGLALGLRLAGLRTRVLGVVVNDMFPLTAPVIVRLANRTADLLRERGAVLDLPPLVPGDVTMRADWLGTTYGDPTPASTTAVEDAATRGLTLEPVYTGKALAAVRDLVGTVTLPEPVLWLNTHGPR